MLSNEEYLKSLAGLIGIESVAFVDVGSDAPYGAGSAKALDYVLELCRSFGFETKLCENHKMGWAQIGSGEEIVGILCHLDVVPAGSGWDYEPYALTEVGDRLYGRGTTDDKGPAISAIYAMKDLLDSGVKLNRRVRILFGQCEEVGDWLDMEYYKTHEELPTFGFTPDGNFPAIYGEKRIVHMSLTIPLEKSGLLEFTGGAAVNMVPDHCKVRYLLEDDAEVELEATGKSAHGSTPEEGVNAITILMDELGRNGETHSPLVEFYNQYIGNCLDGSRIGCGLHDEQSGSLSMNVGTVTTTEDSIVLGVDVREPISFTTEDVLNAVSDAAAKYGITVALTGMQEPVYLDKNGPVITKLMQVYREETGDDSEPEVIGGGTYARGMKNIVAFGPILPGREVTEHQKNEYILKEDFLLLRTIYRKAIQALAE